MSFRLQAKNVFLTYPHCPLSKEDLLALLLAKGGLPTVQYHTIAIEAHQDGTPHLHAILSFSSKLTTRDARFFDVVSDDVTYHPNVQTVRSVRNSIEYVKKDGNYISTHPSDVGSSSQQRWATILDAETRDAFLQRARELDPKEYVLRHDAIVSFAEKHYAPIAEPYVPNPDYNFILPDTITQWLDTEFQVRVNLSNPTFVLSPPALRCAKVAPPALRCAYPY